jgi:hypothetical protein
MRGELIPLPGCQLPMQLPAKDDVPGAIEGLPAEYAGLTLQQAMAEVRHDLTMLPASDFVTVAWLVASLQARERASSARR